MLRFQCVIQHIFLPGTGGLCATLFAGTASLDGVALGSCRFLGSKTQLVKTSNILV